MRLESPTLSQSWVKPGRDRNISAFWCCDQATYCYTVITSITDGSCEYGIAHIVTPKYTYGLEHAPTIAKLSLLKYIKFWAWSDVQPRSIVYKQKETKFTYNTVWCSAFHITINKLYYSIIPYIIMCSWIVWISSVL